MEKWLKEVQLNMFESVAYQLRAAYDDYWNAKRNVWVVSWPGQVVQTISCMTWTKEVSMLRLVFSFIFIGNET